MKYAVKLRTDLNVEMIEASNQQMLGFCYQHIGCGMIEIVRPKWLDRPYVLAIDEEGLLKDMPVVNFIGSYLYETHKHRNPIVGNALLLKEIDTDDGPDLGFLDEDEAIALAAEMHKIGKVAFDTIRKTLEDAGVLERMEVLP